MLFPRTLTLGRIVAAAATVLFATGLFMVGPARAAGVEDRWPNRAAIVDRVADIRKITTPEGIEALEEVEIGGVKQWISIRGMNKSNPVLLVVHGGPGTPMMPAAWTYQRPWEDVFTVVNWDQRGVGKNAATTTNKDELVKTLTVDRMVSDGEEVLAYLRKRLNKDKVIVLGFSWGSVLGAELVKRRPEWVSAYVGVGQMVAIDNEKYLYDRTMELARKAGDAEAIKGLEALAPYPRPDGPTPVEAMIGVRRWALKYNGGWYGRSSFDLFYGLSDWAPEYASKDVDAWPEANGWAARELTKSMKTYAFEKRPAVYKVPFFLFQGRYDLHTPYVAAVDYFKHVRAPYKKLETFERSSHFVMAEEPGRFFLKLVEDVLPVAGEGPYFTRDPEAPGSP